MGFTALTTFILIVVLTILALCVWIYFHNQRNRKKKKLFPLLELAQAKPQIALLLGGALLTILGEGYRAGLPQEARSGTTITFSLLGILLFIFGLATINRPTLPKAVNRTLSVIAKWLQVTSAQTVFLITSFLLAGIAIMASGDALLMRAPLVALLAWVLSGTFTILGTWPLKPSGKAISWRPFVIAGVLALLGFLLRGINTGGIPNTLTGDEASAGLFGVGFIHGEVDNILGFGWYSFPALYFYIQALSISIFGQTTEALRITSALAGALTVGAVYLAGRALYSHRAGLFAAIFLAGLHFHIHFSRIGLNNIWDGFWFTVILSLVWWAWKHERREVFLFAGLALGISQYDYVSVRLLFALIPAWLLFAGLADRAWFRRNRAAIVLMFLIAIVIFLPLAANYARHFDQFMAPMQRVSLLGPWLENEKQITGQPAWRILAHQLWLSLQAFTNTNLRHWYTPEVPMLRSFAAGFFLLGIVLIGLEWKKPQHWLVLIWLGVFVISGGMSESTPAAQRYIGAAPAAAIVLGYALTGISDRLSAALKRGTRVFASISLTIVILLAANDVNFYFNDFTNRGDYSGPNTAIADHLARYLQGKPDGTQVAFFGQPRMGYLSISSLPYLAPKAIGLDMGQPLGSAENPAINPGYVIFVFLPEHLSDLESLKAMFPRQSIHQMLGLNEDFLYWYVEFQDYPNG
jgi:4-amino-4-deoxy-L-arabinose transferase-like glycosyltransferase